MMELAAKKHEGSFINQTKQYFSKNEYVMKPIQVNPKIRKNIDEMESIHISK